MDTTRAPDVLVYFEDRIVPLSEAKVSILTHALHYGTGVFEGILGYWAEDRNDLFLVRPEDHFARWIQNCSILRIDQPLSPRELTDIVLQLVRQNGFRTNLYIRPLAYRSSLRIKVRADDESRFAVIAIPFGDYLNSENGIHAGVVSWRRIEDDAVPGRAKICGAYVNSVLASDEARRNGFDEGIFLTESGHVAEGSACNVFLVRGDKLVTPAVTENILEGITRASVMELASRELRLEVVERRVDRSELYMADEVFFTGTAVEIAPVTRIDHRRIGTGEIGPITRGLRRLYGARRWKVPNLMSAAKRKERPTS